eukprot:TRINITY_DN62089_c0_g1_i1.p1 TRINITY_DN62089_c0_g1~~TRINITY_DN62089_c0_g1_i1.p1  ORF type:complete len:794 (+),score=149.56 TRINITY_DN62089_c0_g1_i1:78-2384(+)
MSVLSNGDTLDQKMALAGAKKDLAIPGQKLRVLHLIGSVKDIWYYDLSFVYARHLDVAEELDRTRFEFLFAVVHLDGMWSFPPDLSEAAVESATKEPLGTAITKILKLNIDVMLPHMYDLEGVTRYRSLFDLLQIPYLGNNDDTNWKSADKGVTKHYLDAANVRVPRGEVLVKGWNETPPAFLKVPFIAKPCLEEGSRGMSLVKRDEDIASALSHAFTFDERVIVEEYIAGREIRAAVVEEEDGALTVLPKFEYFLEDVRTPESKVNMGSNGRMTQNPFKEARKPGDTQCPAELKPQLHLRVDELVTSAHRVLKCKYFSLYDIRIDADDQPYILEASPYISFAPGGMHPTMASKGEHAHLKHPHFFHSCLERVAKEGAKTKANGTSRLVETNATDADGKYKAHNVVLRTMLAPWAARALGTALNLNLVEALCQQKKMTLPQLGEVAGCINGTENLYNVLRCLARAGLVDELDGKCFAPNAATQVMRRDLGPGAGDLVSHLINDEKWLSMLNMPNAVKQNTVAFELAHGMDVYEYGEQEKAYTFEQRAITHEHPIGSAERRADFAKEFMRAMAWFSSHSIGNLFEVFDWSSVDGLMMDVGGGTGVFLAKALQASKATGGILYDRQWVLDSVDEKTFASCPPMQKIAGDVLEPFPPSVRGAVDVIVMKHFLSAFSDSKVATILGHTAAALKDSGRIFLLQSLVPEVEESAFCDDGVSPASFAVEIMCDCPGGFWRSGSQWKQLFAASGFKLMCTIRSSPNMSMMMFVKSD